MSKYRVVKMTAIQFFDDDDWRFYKKRYSPDTILYVIQKKVLFNLFWHNVDRFLDEQSAIKEIEHLKKMHSGQLPSQILEKSAIKFKQEVIWEDSNEKE